ncbi:26S proteasome complex subunit [Gnomoniopsis sp. IMI 355080]|nr:26S proteasome complex subunit [Gnomoniopsis sp. IMI 355080]
MASSAPQKDNQPAASTEAGTQPEDTTKKSATALEEDDEFEDFPVEDWPVEETEAANSGETTKHLWEESWDDDDTSDDFSQQLKEELKKVEASKRQ